MARPERALLSFRNAADPERPQPLVSFSAARRASRRRRLQSHRGTGRAVVRLLAADRAEHRRHRDHRIPNRDRAQRQPFVSQLAHHRAGARLFRRSLLGEATSAVA